jgi:Domain of unknown function (DUF4267)
MKKSLDIAAIVLTGLLLLGFAVLSLRGLIDPQAASTRFGAAVSDQAGALFYRVYLSRNLVIVAAGAIFLLTRHWTALAILLTLTAALPLFDMTVLSQNGVSPPFFHPAAFAVIAVAAALAWRRARESGA